MMRPEDHQAWHESGYSQYEHDWLPTSKTNKNHNFNRSHRNLNFQPKPSKNTKNNNNYNLQLNNISLHFKNKISPKNTIKWFQQSFNWNTIFKNQSFKSYDYISFFTQNWLLFVLLSVVLAMSITLIHNEYFGNTSNLTQSMIQSQQIKQQINQQNKQCLIHENNSFFDNIITTDSNYKFDDLNTHTEHIHQQSHYKSKEEHYTFWNVFFGRIPGHL